MRQGRAKLCRGGEEQVALLFLKTWLAVSFPLNVEAGAICAACLL